ncbi:MAG TPA: diacylglycerol kinase family protein [Gemmatimonadaceae bacterium]
MRRALMIVNPAARRAAGARDEAIKAFAAASVTCDVRLTERPGHAAELARTNAASYDAVFTLGGDGTAVEVISALSATGPAVGVLPGGTGNVIARSLKIPLSVARAVPALLSGAETRMDLGRLGDGRHFVIGVGVGVDADMIAGASYAMKQRLGFLAYFMSGIGAGIKLNRFRYRITADGAVHEGEAVSVLVANLGSILGGLITLGRQIREDDGVFHICVFSPRNVLDAFRVFGRMLAGDVSGDRSVTYILGRNFRLETVPSRRAQADGELLGETPLDITVQPGAARLLAPRATTAG